MAASRLLRCGIFSVAGMVNQNTSVLFIGLAVGFFFANRKGQIMKHSFLQVACAAAIGALAIVAQAQNGSPAAPSKPNASPASPSNPAASRTDTDPVAKCNELKGAVRIDCLSNAKRNSDHAVNEMPAGVAAAGAAGATTSTRGFKNN
jgi:hypothetical protein